MTKVNIFIFSGIFYLTWILTNNFFENISYSFIVLLIIELFFLVVLLKYKKFFSLALFFVVFFSLWIFVSKINLDKINENIVFSSQFLEKAEIIAEIQEVKEVESENIVYKWKIISINNQKPENKIFAEVFINYKNEKKKKWTIIKSTSKPYFYKDFNNFSYKNYMISNGFYFKYYANYFDIIWKNEINIIEEKIISLREKLLETIKKIYPENEAIFLWWILLWAREELPDELKQNFNNSWLTHFIAVSWFNITILIVFFSIFIKYLPKFLQIPIMSIIIFLFVLLVWFTPPVVRAWIMGFLGYLVLQNGRQANIIAIWILTLIIMVSLNPFSINYDVSLHLSFLAVIWIVFTEKFFNKFFSFLPNFFEIRTAISITLSALVFTIPVMIFSFWQLSYISPISNLLVSWNIPFAMLLWFLSVIWYLIFDKIWLFFWFFTYLLLRWNIEVVNFLWSKDFLVLKTDFWEYKWYYQIIFLIIIWFIVIFFKKEKD